MNLIINFTSHRKFWLLLLNSWKLINIYSPWNDTRANSFLNDFSGNRSLLIHLTHYSPVLLFYTSWKHKKTSGLIKATPGCNGLNLLNIRSENWQGSLSVFFLSQFFLKNIHESLDCREKGKLNPLIALYLSHLLHQHFGTSQAITAESSPLHIASDRPDSDRQPLISERMSLTTKLRAFNKTINTF